MQQLAQLPPTQIRPEEVSIVAPRHGSPPRLNNFIARMEQSLSSDSSWIDEAPTPPALPPLSPPRTIILGSPNVSKVVDQANGFATSAPKRRKVEIGREDVGPHVPNYGRPELTVYDTLVRMVQEGVYARAQDVDRANGFAPPPPQRQYSAIEGTAPRPHLSNHRHPSPPLPEHPPAQPSYLTRANLLPWFSAQGIDLRPEEAQVLDAFLAQRYESPPPRASAGLHPPTDSHHPADDAAADPSTIAGARADHDREHVGGEGESVAGAVAQSAVYAGADGVGRYGV